VSYLTLVYLTLDIAPAETVAAAVDAGFSSVGIRITGRRIADPYTQVIGNPAVVREIRRRAEDGGVRLSNISAYHMFPDTRLSDLVPIVDTTAELGIGIIVVNGHDPDEARFTEKLAQYAQAAARADIRIALEFMAYSGVKTLAQARRIIEASGQGNIGLLHDPLHLDRSGGTPADIKGDPTPVCFAQLCDALSVRPVDEDGLRNEARTRRLCPGEGDLPLAAYLAALPPGTEIECELPDPAHAALSAAERARRALVVTRRFLDAQGWPAT
jgi:sugar phosphate isomerase/epimerase